MAAGYNRSGQMSPRTLQKWLEDAEQELAELYALQNPPPPVDAATQTKPVYFYHEQEEGVYTCNWVTVHEVSMAIEFVDDCNFNWERKHPYTKKTQKRTILDSIAQFCKEQGKTARVFLKTTFGDKIRITRGLHTSATDAANLRHLRHFNAVDIDGNTYHVYCRGVDAHFRIVSFTKIVTTLFQ
jgi:hypothetical protein